MDKSMNNNLPVSTTIYDDRPKFQAVTILGIFFGILVFIGIPAWAYLDYLQLDQRAQIALAQAKIIGDATMGYKASFVTVFWLGLSAVTVATAALAVTVAVSVSAMIGARAVAAVRAALLPAGPRVIAAPARREELEG